MDSMARMEVLEAVLSKADPKTRTALNFEMVIFWKFNYLRCSAYNSFQEY